MNEFYVNMDSSGDELINSTFNLLEDSQDTVNMAPVNDYVVYSSAYDDNFDRNIFEGASNLSTLQDDKDILTFMEKQQNKSTLYKDKTDMNKFTKYLSSIGVHKLPELLTKQELDNALCKFYINVTRNDGALTEPDTLTSYKNSIARYLESKNSHDIKKDPDFVRSRVVLKKRRAELTRMGKGNKPNACRALENEEMDVLFNETDTFGAKNPEQLQRTIWRKIACHFGHRARDESRFRRFTIKFLVGRCWYGMLKEAPKQEMVLLWVIFVHFTPKLWKLGILDALSWCTMNLKNADLRVC